MGISRRNWLRARFVESDNTLRPPWLKSPLSFTEQCTRCGDCLKACPESIIQVGDGGFPEIDFRLGECTFCGDCAKSCKEELFFDSESQKPWHYTAEIQSNCFAKNQVSCQSCQDVCDQRAIRFAPQLGSVSQPIINMVECNGCGACVSVCPASAIKVKSPGINQTHSPENEDSQYV